MKPFLNCAIYLAICGIGSFFLGRGLAKYKLAYGRFPYRSLPFEKEGELYNRIGIRAWKDALPDMSKIVPGLIPSKKIPVHITSEQIEGMIQETCVAEWTHLLLIVLGFGCVLLWEGTGGWIMAILFAIGNIPYILIQRHNRPKLIRILQKKVSKRKL